MSGLVARLRAEVDEEVNEPLDRLLDEAADRIEHLAGAALHDGNDGLQTDRGVSRPVRAAFYVPYLRHGSKRPVFDA
jgi:hypothetical protein